MKKIIFAVVALLITVTPVSAQATEQLNDVMWEQLNILFVLYLEYDVCDAEVDRVICSFPIGGNEFSYSDTRNGITVSITVDEDGTEFVYGL